MALYGVDALDRPRRGLLGLLQPVLADLAVRDAATACSGCAAPLSGLTALSRCRALVGVVAVMIGTVSFDGLSEAPLWVGHRRRSCSDFFGSLGLSSETAFEVSNFVGLVALAIALVSASTGWESPG